MSAPSLPSGFGDESSAPPPYNPRDPRSLPLYEGDSIEGSFETDPGNSDSIRSITISVGSIVTSPLADDTSAFFHLSSSLWSRGPSTLRVGHRVWPFSISLPSEVTGGGRSSTFRLPETFALRKKFRPRSREACSALKISTFKTQFRYVPRTAPGPLSVLRQGAYTERTALLGPRDDPPGWETPVTVMAHGHAFKRRQAVVQCTMSFATPLSYTRGSVIPCWIILETYTRTLEGEIRVPADLTSFGEMGLAQF
ncbi:hypothetical protein DFH09DRAFT_1326442 [Mycena vulgaris]|nr:hypothetical protein DFH09DRAFT_1326442 [Mycena vulgaris]